MSYNRIPSVAVTAESKVLVSCVSIDGEKSKNSSRFGITYDCVFNDEDISIRLYSPFELKDVEISKLKIPYHKIENIKFSIVRLPILSTHQHGPDFGLDIVINTRDTSVYLETIAFKLIPNIVRWAKEKNIPIIDPIGLCKIEVNLSYAWAKEKFMPIYDELKKEFNLQDYRNVDDRSRITQ